MTDWKTLATADGRQLTAARAMAGLTIAELAEAAGVTPRTVVRLEAGGEIRIAGRKRHGHVEQGLWLRILNVLRERGVELIPEGDNVGSAVRWFRPRSQRSAP